MGNMSLFSILTFLGLFLVQSQSFAALSASDIHPGYTYQPSMERDLKYYETILVPSYNPNTNSISLYQTIFNDKLSKEFKERYEEQFGRTSAEKILNISVKQDLINPREIDSAPETIREENEQQRTFGEYMVKRLAEDHLDRFIRGKPSMRPVLEVKEKLSKVQVKVNQEVKLNINYSYSGNYLDLIAVNPWIDSKVVIEMDPSQFGPTDAKETKLYLGYHLTKKVYVESNILTNDGKASLITKRRMTPTFETSLTASSFYHDRGETLRESLYLVGLSWSGDLDW